MTKNQIFYAFLKNKTVLAMSQTNVNCLAGSVVLKIMFYRDTQVLVIHLSRGTCARGDIVIHSSFALARHMI